MIAAPTHPAAVFELKSAAFDLVALRLETADLEALAKSLDQRYAATPGLFDQDPVLIDLDALREADAAIDFAALVALLRGHGLLAVAVRGGSANQTAAARAAGLAEAQAAAPRVVRARAEAAAEAAAAAETAEAGAANAAAVEPPPTIVVPRGALIVDRPLRSGQRVYAKGADLVVLAHVSHGAEVIADGHIHVYAALRGRALAGARGDTEARIFCTCMEPQLISIAGIYRTTEQPLAADVLGRAAQVRLEGDRIVVEPLNH
ncbi:MAG: septum site-determining protein MinC [Burkholderiales bacterium]|nr:septum site-determining protein MinC [Burkholderiales bacterium]